MPDSSSKEPRKPSFPTLRVVLVPVDKPDSYTPITTALLNQSRSVENDGALPSPLPSEMDVSPTPPPLAPDTNGNRNDGTGSSATPLRVSKDEKKTEVRPVTPAKRKAWSPVTPSRYNLRSAPTPPHCELRSVSIPKSPQTPSKKAKQPEVIDLTHESETSEDESECETNSEGKAANIPDEPLRTINFEWPGNLGQNNAKRSLCFVKDLSAPFQGPLIPDLISSCIGRSFEPHVNELMFSYELQPASMINTAAYPPPPATPITLERFLMEGRVWSGFGASVATGEALVAKFTTTRHSSCTEGRREAWIYHHLLKPLWGFVVPLWYGVYFGKQAARNGTVNPNRPTMELLCAVMEDAGRAMKEHEAKALCDEDKQVIIDKYQALHDAGVVHRSAKYKHWLWHPGRPIATLRLIDFGVSTVDKKKGMHSLSNILNGDSDNFASLAADEMRKVHEMLDYNSDEGSDDE